MYVKGNEEEAFGWWLARIKMFRGEFAVVDYVGWETTYTDIVPIDRLRPVNNVYVLIRLFALIAHSIIYFKHLLTWCFSTPVLVSDKLKFYLLAA